MYRSFKFYFKIIPFPISIPPEKVFIDVLSSNNELISYINFPYKSINPPQSFSAVLFLTVILSTIWLSNPINLPPPPIEAILFKIYIFKSFNFGHDLIKIPPASFKAVLKLKLEAYITVS